MGYSLYFEQNNRRSSCTGLTWLSGLTLVPLERHLKTVEIGWRFGFAQAIKRPAVHQVGADQSGKGEWAIESGLCRWASSPCSTSWKQQAESDDDLTRANGIARAHQQTW
jgi:hypothetical protein